MSHPRKQTPYSCTYWPASPLYRPCHPLRMAGCVRATAILSTPQRKGYKRLTSVGLHLLLQVPFPVFAICSSACLPYNHHCLARVPNCPLELKCHQRPFTIGGWLCADNGLAVLRQAPTQFPSGSGRTPGQAFVFLSAWAGARLHSFLY